ncbi:MAG: DNA methyltransferase, partial [bacterium]
MEFLNWPLVPWDFIRIYDQELSELDFRAIELAENFDRKDMSYVEEVALKREINLLQIQAHGAKIGRSKDSPGWSQADTARLLKESAATTALDLKLAAAIDKFPELGLDKCKSKSEAMKRLKNVGKTVHATVESKKYIEQVGSTNKLFNSLSSSYIVGDCFEILKRIPDKSMHFIEIDSPYAIDLHKVKKDNECIGYNEIDPKDYPALMQKLFNECHRVMRDNSWLICWFAQDPWFHHIVAWLRGANFKMHTIPGIWAKPQGQTNQAERSLANSYEAFFYARKGDPKLNKPGRSNIFSYNAVPHTKKIHPTQRPIELMVELYTTFTVPGQTGFIPFLGSGVGLLAGHQCKINLIGTDLTPEFKAKYIMLLKD